MSVSTILVSETKLTTLPHSLIPLQPLIYGMPPVLLNGPGTPYGSTETLLLLIYLIYDNQLSAVIDFGGMAIGDPACDLAIAWTLLTPSSKTIFLDQLNLDSDTMLRARAWALWKATFELNQIDTLSSPQATFHLDVINQLLIS